MATTRDDRELAAAERAAGELDDAAKRLLSAAMARARHEVTQAIVKTRSTAMNTAITERISGVADKAKGAAVAVKDKAVEVTDTVRHPPVKEDSGGTTVIEHIDAGVPVDVAYEQWTTFGEFAEFLDPGHAQVLEDVPKERLVWRSRPGKGHIDGAVTFHELAPQLARIVVVLEAHPRGIVERTGSLLRPTGRRLRSELGNFERHVMAECVLHSPTAKKAVKKRRKSTRKTKAAGSSSAKSSSKAKTTKAKGAKG